MKSVFLMFISLLTVCTGAWGQMQYASPHVALAAKRLHIEQTDTLKEGLNRIEREGIVLSVRLNKEGVVEHIGQCLFAEELRRENPLPIYDFVEFATLSQRLKLTDLQLTYKEVKFIVGDWQKMALINDSTDCAVQQLNNKTYRLQWKSKQGAVMVCMEFPTKYDLILGETRSQIEADFIAKVCRHKPGRYSTEGTHPENADWQKMVLDGVTIQRRKAEHYIDTLINNGAYYWEKDSVWVPLVDARFPEFSIANLLWGEGELAKEDYPLEARFVCSGNKVEVKQLTIRQLMDYALRSGCKAYVGFSGEENGELKGSLFFYNSLLGYDHVMSFTINPTLIGTSKLAFRGRIYLFSPTSNVKTLIYEQKLIKK